MTNYTVEQLCEDGPPFAMAMLLDCLKAGEPFVTYGAIRDELEYQLNIDTIFPTQIGYVAGSLMDKILEVDPKAPLINSMITRPTGLPGKGVGGYFADRYNVESYRKWSKVSPKKKRELLDREHIKILRYRNWDKINKELFGTTAKSKLRKQEGSEVDGFHWTGRSYGGPAESEEHEELKKWVAAHPQEIGLRKSFGKGVPESCLLSGDTVDVLFADGDYFVTVEVKSCRSNDEDFRRGIYQCVKYKKVKEAEHLPNKVRVQAVLVTERELNFELRTRARLLGVKFKCVSVNKKNHIK
ncbi:MAG: hypothetical protein KAS66_12570 [Candidatus Omnitrophica bacterium]|nr:hypothetical protein [Candidatus Omnitrophota bacterium]